MAADLEHTPRAGLDAQLCGDAHLSNFGLSASPERTLVFDLNDFDETLPGPFEYDVKRMATSFTIAGAQQRIHRSRCPERDDGIGRRVPRGDGRVRRDADDGRLACPVVGTGHHERDRTNVGARRCAEEGEARRAEKFAAKESDKARTRDSLSALSKLAERVDGQYRIVYQPPIVIPAREVSA